MTGLLLGVALAGLLHAPAEVVAHQEARTPVVRPKADAGPWVEDRTVRVSPKVERALERRRARLERPKELKPPLVPVRPPVLVRATVPTERPVSPAPRPRPPARTDAAKPEPPEDSPASPPPPPPPPKTVTSTPQPPPYVPADSEDDDDDDDDDAGDDDD